MRGMPLREPRASSCRLIGVMGALMMSVVVGVVGVVVVGVVVVGVVVVVWWW